MLESRLLNYKTWKKSVIFKDSLLKLKFRIKNCSFIYLKRLNNY